MKRIVLFILAVALVFCISCSSISYDDFKAQKLYDEENCSVALNHIKETNEYIRLHFGIDNSFEQNGKIYLRKLKLNDVVIPSELYTAFEAGKGKNAEICLEKELLKLVGIDGIGSVSASFEIKLEDKTEIILKGGDTAKTKNRVKKFKEKDYISEDYIGDEELQLHLIKKMRRKGGIYSDFALIFFVKNNTAADLTLRAAKTMLNGKEISSVLNADIASGEIGFMLLKFYEADIEAMDINSLTDLERISFDILAMNRETGKLLQRFESGEIEI